MFIARVVGHVWATRKHSSLENLKLLLVCPMDGITGKLYGKPVLAVESRVDAGIGDPVLVLDEGNSARQILQDNQAPIRTIIVGILDEVKVGNQRVKYG